MFVMSKPELYLYCDYFMTISTTIKPVLLILLGVLSFCTSAQAQVHTSKELQFLLYSVDTSKVVQIGKLENHPADKLDKKYKRALEKQAVTQKRLCAKLKKNEQALLAGIRNSKDSALVKVLARQKDFATIGNDVERINTKLKQLNTATAFGNTQSLQQDLFANEKNIQARIDNLINARSFLPKGGQNLDQAKSDLFYYRRQARYYINIAQKPSGVEQILLDLVKIAGGTNSLNADSRSGASPIAADNELKLNDTCIVKVGQFVRTKIKLQYSEEDKNNSSSINNLTAELQKVKNLKKELQKKPDTYKNMPLMFRLDKGINWQFAKVGQSFNDGFQGSLGPSLKLNVRDYLAFVGEAQCSFGLRQNFASTKCSLSNVNLISAVQVNLPLRFILQSGLNAKYVMSTKSEILKNSFVCSPTFSIGRVISMSGRQYSILFHYDHTTQQFYFKNQIFIK
jgi:hypothetical protein